MSKILIIVHVALLILFVQHSALSLSNKKTPTEKPTTPSTPTASTPHVVSEEVKKQSFLNKHVISEKTMEQIFSRHNPDPVNALNTLTERLARNDDRNRIPSTVATTVATQTADNSKVSEPSVSTFQYAKGTKYHQRPQHTLIVGSRQDVVNGVAKGQPAPEKSQQNQDIHLSKENFPQLLIVRDTKTKAVEKVIKFDTQVEAAVNSNKHPVHLESRHQNQNLHSTTHMPLIGPPRPTPDPDTRVATYGDLFSPGWPKMKLVPGEKPSTSNSNDGKGLQLQQKQPSNPPSTAASGSNTFNNNAKKQQGQSLFSKPRTQNSQSHKNPGQPSTSTVHLSDKGNTDTNRPLSYSSLLPKLNNANNQPQTTTATINWPGLGKENRQPQTGTTSKSIFSSQRNQNTKSQTQSGTQSNKPLSNNNQGNSGHLSSQLFSNAADNNNKLKPLVASGQNNQPNTGLRSSIIFSNKENQLQTNSNEGTKQQINPNIGSQRLGNTNLGRQHQGSSTIFGSQGQVRPGGSQGQVRPSSQGQVRPGSSQGQVRPGGSQGQVRPGSQGQVRPGDLQGQVRPGGSQGQVRPGGSQGQVRPGGSQGQVRPGSQGQGNINLRKTQQTTRRPT